MRLLIALVWLTFFLVRCRRDDSVLVQQKVAAAAGEFRKKKEAECRLMLMEIADSRADSLILADARQYMRDSLARMLPAKPVQPPALPPLDSLPVKPFFKQ